MGNWQVRVSGFAVKLIITTVCLLKSAIGSLLLHWIIIIYKFEEKINIEKFSTKNQKRFNREMNGLP